MRPLVCLIVFSLPFSLTASLSLQGYFDEIVMGLKRCKQCFFILQHVCFGVSVVIKRTVVRWRPITLKPLFSFIQSSQVTVIAMATVYFSLSSACFQSKWDLCRYSWGSTYCIQFIPSQQHSCWNAATIMGKITHHKLRWCLKLELQCYWEGRWANVQPRVLEFTTK